MDTIGSTGTIGPGMYMWVPCKSELDPNLAKLVTDGLSRLFLIGEVLYTDAFGHRRHIRFCEGVDWLEGGHIATYAADRHNEAD